MKMNKLLTSSVAILMAFGLAGCAANNSAPASNVHHSTSAKVVKSNNHKTDQTNSSSQKAAATVESHAAVNNSVASQAPVQPQQQPVATQASQSNVTTTPSQQVTAQQPQSEENVLNGFFKASGVKQAANDQYIVTKQNNENYQIEIRNSNDDNTVSHLSGLYQYNPTSGNVQHMNITTGQFE